MENYSHDDRPPNDREHANWLSAVLIMWTWKIFRLGAKRDVYEKDLPETLTEHKAAFLGEKIARLWSAEYERAKSKQEVASLGYVIFKCFGAEYMRYGLALAFQELLIKPIQPLFLGLLVRYFTEDNAKNTNPIGFPMYVSRCFYYYHPNQCAIQLEEALFYAGGVTLCSLIGVFVQHPYMLSVMHLGMKVRVALLSLLYRKTLRMSMLSLGPKTVGNVMNLMTNDATRFDMVPMFLHYLWISPIQMCMFIFILHQHIGISSFIGFSVLIALIPLQVLLAYLNKNLRYKTALKTDERVRLMNEIIAGIGVVKMYGWELAFLKLIAVARRREMSMLIQTSFIRGLIMSMIMFTSRLATFLTLIMYVVVFQHKIGSEVVFIIVGYYMIVRASMSVFFPQGVTQFAETLISIRRSRDYLLNEDTKIGDPSVLDPRLKDVVLQESGSISVDFLAAPPKPSIRIIEAYARWNTKHHILKDIEFSITDGQLVVLIGRIGSGKTSLVHVILKELPLARGFISIVGVISYASKDPWLFAGSIRQNILFGNEYKRNRYKRVCKVCALMRDFEFLPYGDQTIVGERGISLSGGQRSRINLARCIYKQADIYVLDDPLSAVDVHVGSQIFNECISSFLKGKIRILITHQMQFIREVDLVVILERGKVLAKGSYTELVNSGMDFSNYLETEASTDAAEFNTTDMLDLHLKSISVIENLRESILNAGHRSSLLETRGTGRISCDLYKKYLNAGGNCGVIFGVILLFVLAQAFASAGDFVTSQWTKFEDLRSLGIDPSIYGGMMSLTSGQLITIYSVITAILIIVTIVRSLVFFTVAVRASITLHDAMFDSIVRGQMRFFNTNPSGRILNRFSKDMGSVDEDLPYAMIDFFQILLSLVGAVIVMGTSCYYLIPGILLVLIFIMCIRNYYLKTSRSLKRVEGTVRSNIYAHLNASIQGLSTIRSHMAEEILTYEFDKHMDLHSSSWYLYIGTARSFSLWMDLMVVSMLFFGSYGLLTLKLLGINVAAGEMGLIVTQCLMLTGLIPWGMRQSAEMENQMTSVERIYDYIEIDHEPDIKSKPDKRPHDDWPSEGEIVMQDVELRYSMHDEPVLKKLSLTIHPREKIGIVGRTGAGKSSLISALFRLAFQSGAIFVDGIDIFTLGLHDVRKRIMIIPQEPVIFSGTYRFNLDPFRQYPDSTLLAALSIVDLERGTRNILSKVLTEGDANFSTGQKQLLCLARALVRNSKILILDEATANMDPHTDKLIQNIIRTKFTNCTILTIAHRLVTIMDSDRVLVINQGRLLEFEHPYILLKDPKGMFTNMVDGSGKGTADHLKRIAERNYRKGNIETSSDLDMDTD